MDLHAAKQPRYRLPFEVPYPVHRRQYGGRQVTLTKDKGMKTRAKRTKRRVVPEAELLTLSKSDLARAVYPIEQWGTTAFEYVLGPEHCRLDAIRAPEGLVVVLRCQACGGRHEVLLPAPGKANHGGMDSSRAIQSLERAAAASACFKAEHEDCGVSPMAHAYCCEITSFREKVITLAEFTLSKAHPIPATHHLLFGDGKVMAISADGLPNTCYRGDHARTSASAALIYMTRRWLHANRSRPVAVVTTLEAWCALDTPDVLPVHSPDRQEAFMLTIVTPRFADMTRFPIVRSTEGDENSPATLGPPSTSRALGRSELVDGFFARF